MREPVSFPDVTICPLRNLDIGIIKSISNRSIDRRPGARSTKHPHTILDENMTASNYQFEKAYYELTAPYFHLFWHYYKTHISLFGVLLSRTNLLPNIDFDTLKSGGIPLWELMLRCTWQGQSCDFKNNIREEFDPYFLRCATYRAPVSHVMSEGVEGGVSVLGIYGNSMVDWKKEVAGISYPVILLGLQEYNHPLSGNQGARVVIHPPGSMASPSAEGIDIPPGYSGSIGITFKHTVSLGKPYGKCSIIDPRGNSGETYRLLPCLRRCIQQHIIKECGCLDTMLPFPKGYSRENLNGLQYCGRIEPLEPECEFKGTVEKPPESCLNVFVRLADRIKCGTDIQTKMEQQEDLMETCDCYTPCNDYKYTIQYSLSGWPPGPEMDSVFGEVMSNFSTNSRCQPHPT